MRSAQSTYTSKSCLVMLVGGYKATDTTDRYLDLFRHLVQDISQHKYSVCIYRIIISLPQFGDCIKAHHQNQSSCGLALWPF